MQSIPSAGPGRAKGQGAGFHDAFGAKQQHFLLSALPTSCTFCVPAGPEGLIEVHTKQTLRNSPEPVKGRLGCSATIPAECFVVCWTAKP
jgi:Na+-translocating ferredoxin:NAD+ oxidoreductase RNF subunit RnfB